MIDLRGTKVLVIRPRDQSENLCKLISTIGGEAIALPTIQTLPSGQLSRGEVLELLTWAYNIVFISRNAANYLDKLVDNVKQRVKGKIVFAVGRGTVTTLEELGVGHVLCPKTQYGSEGLLELPSLSESNIKGQNLLIVRGDNGRELLKERLKARGANVQYASVYYRSIPKVDPEYIESIWKNLIPDIIVATSNQGLLNLITMTEGKYRKTLFSQRLVVMSERIADTALKEGFKNTPIVAKSQSDEGLIEAVQNSIKW